MENLTGGTPPVRYLPCVVPCKLYFADNLTSVRVMEKLGFETLFTGIGPYQGADRPIVKNVWRP